MKAIEVFFRRSGNALAILGGITIIAMMGLIVADVTMKYLINDPIDGTTAVVAAYFMVALVFLPLAHVSLTSGHLLVEMFTQKISSSWLRLLNGFTGLITLTYLIFLVVFTSLEAVRRTVEGEAWETAADLMIVWPSRWFLPIGLAAMAGVVLTQTWRLFRRSDPDEMDKS